MKSVPSEQADKRAEIKKIETDALVLEKEQLKKIAVIEDEMMFAREKATVDSAMYKVSDSLVTGPTVSRAGTF